MAECMNHHNSLHNTKWMSLALPRLVSYLSRILPTFRHTQLHEIRQFLDCHFPKLNFILVFWIQLFFEIDNLNV